MIDERALAQIENTHASGITSAEILDVLAGHDIHLTEATLRKYVQLGLLPRSVRVGRKGKHQGSQGIYPIHVIRQILRIKQMLAESFTIEQIQREFLFIRNDVEQLEQTLLRIFRKLDIVLRERRREALTQTVHREVNDARILSRELLSHLVMIEGKLTSQSRLEKAAAS